MTPAQCRVARELLGWIKSQFAIFAKLAIETLRDFEAGRPARWMTLHLIRTAMEGAGIEFTAETDESVGVRLRKAAK